jgi:hypothetical protein
MWSIFEREINKCPHITLASLKAMTSDVMTDLDREVIIHAYKKFQSWIEALMEDTGVFIKQMCILYAYKLSLKFSSEYIHPNYFFYCYECFHRVCPNLSSAPCAELFSTIIIAFEYVHPNRACVCTFQDKELVFKGAHNRCVYNRNGKTSIIY